MLRCLLFVLIVIVRFTLLMQQVDLTRMRISDRDLVRLFKEHPCIRHVVLDHCSRAGESTDLFAEVRDLLFLFSLRPSSCLIIPLG